MVSQREMIVFLFVVVVLIFLGGVLLKILQSVPFIGNILGQIEAYVPQLTLPVEQENLGEEKVVDLLEGARKGGDYITSVEVGCDIANAIRDDFEKNGDLKKPRKATTDDFQNLIGIGSSYYIIKSRIFSMPVEGGNPKDAGGLSSGARDKLKSVCGGTLPICSWKLDEACVTSVLKNLKVGELPFCGNKGFSDNNGQTVKFGNENCGSSNYKGWTDCKDLCVGGDKINRFDQSGRENVENFGYVAAQDAVSVQDRVGGDKFVPECNVGDCKPNYRYVLYYNRHDSKKSYEIQVLKIPKLTDVAILSPSQVAGDIAKIFKRGSLNSDAGAAYRDLRQSVRITFTPTENILLFDFKDALEKNIRKEKGENDWTIDFQECSDVKDCLENDLQKTKYLQIVKKKDNSVKKNQLDSCDKIKKDFKKFYIRSSMNSNTGKLETGKKYLLVMNQWKHTQFGEPYEESCGWGIKCVACIKDECTYETTPTLSCGKENYNYGWVGEDQIYRLRDVTEHKDFSLIILPIEDESQLLVWGAG